MGKRGQLALDLAKGGNPSALVVRLIWFLRFNGEALTDGEIEWITDTLWTTASKDVKDDLRRAERGIVAMQVEHLMRDEDKPQKMEEVVEAVARQLGRSPRYVYQAIVENRAKAFDDAKIGLAALDDLGMSRCDVTKSFEQRNRKKSSRRKAQE